MPEIEIVSYNPDWQGRFSEAARSLQTLLPGDATIHHIGSTAVAGLAAKDVIDIQVSVTSLDGISPSVIERAGFKHLPIATDHQPPGVIILDDELKKLFFRSELPRVNVHIRERGRFNHRYALLCRDFLRSAPLVAAAYETIKTELALRFPNDADAYYAVKDPVFDLIMVAANEWARSTGWAEADAE